MLRSSINEILQKKFFLMFFTSIIYILGLNAFFTEKALLYATLVLIIGIFAIIKNYVSPKLVLFWYLFFFFAFFNASFRVKDYDSLFQLAPKDATIKGQIVSIPTNGDSEKIKFFFQANEIAYDGNIKKIDTKTLVNLYSDKKNLNIGNYYTISGKLRAPFKASNPSQFDYGKYLQNFNVFTIFYGNKITENEGKLSPKWKFLQSLNNLRTDIIKTHSCYLKSPNLEILGGIVFGDDAIEAPFEIKNSFKNSGLLHILAASGMNVALIYGIWFFLLRKLKAPFNFSVISGIFIIIFYTMMTGMGPSVVRAAFMLIFILLGKLINRDAHSISLLSFVALLMLICNPAYINDIGFQLSFIVTFGLLIMASDVFEKVKFMPNWLSGAIFIPIIAQLWIAPIQMYYFNSFSLYSIFANIIILPFVTVISFGGFISATLSLIKPLSNIVCQVFDFVLNPVLSGLVIISNYFATLPHSLLQMPKPNDLQIFLYYTILLTFCHMLHFGKNKKAIITSIALLFLLLLTFIKIPDNKLITIAFDVQNADAFLIKTPQEKYFLIDSGKMPYKKGRSQANAIILEYLKDKGIKNIEGLIITHFDSDHAGGASDLIDNLKIKKVYVNYSNDKSKLAKIIYKKTKNRLVTIKNETTVYSEKNGVKIKLLKANLPQTEENENENSIITIVSKDNFDELFMGDAGIESFEKISDKLPEKIEVLKVGHHGAKDVVDDKMLKKIKPDYAIISTGVNNYGHPNGITLEILKKNNVKTLRTDRKNAIKIEYLNKQTNIYSFQKNNWILISK